MRAEIPYWWCDTNHVWVFACDCLKICFNQSEHYPDLRSDASSVWNFCTRFSDVISRGNQWHRQMLVVLSGYQNKGVLKVLDNVFFQTSVQGARSGSLSDKVVKFCVDNVCYKVTHDRGCSSSCSSFWCTSYNCNILAWPSCDSSCLNQYSGLGWSQSRSLKKV